MPTAQAMGRLRTLSKLGELEMGTFRYKLTQFIGLFVVMAQSLCLQKYYRVQVLQTRFYFG